MRLSLEVPPPIFLTCINVVVLCVCVRRGGGLKENLKMLRLSLNVPPPFANVCHRRHFCRGGKNEC